jgi:hypothetical protein
MRGAAAREVGPGQQRGWRRLGQAAIQQRRRGVDRAARSRALAGVQQLLGDPRIACRRRGEQVHRGAVRVARGEDLRGATVLERAPRRRQLPVHGRTKDRVPEAQRLACGQDLAAHERLGRRRRAPGVDPGDRGGEVHVGVGVEHRDRARQHRRLLWQPRQAQQHIARDGARPQLTDTTRARGARLDIPAGQRPDELRQQERVAAGRLVASAAEHGVRRRTERGADDARARGFGQRLGHHRLGGLGAYGFQELCRSTGLTATHRDDNRHRDALEPACQVDQPSQRSRVRPLRVVDAQQQRRARREVRRQPVQTVLRRERRVLAGRCAHVPVPAENRLDDRGDAFEQLGAPGAALSREHRLEQLAHHPEAEVALELAAPRA